MKKAFIIPMLAIAAMGLVACNNPAPSSSSHATGLSSSESVSSSESTVPSSSSSQQGPVVTTLTIKNKDAIKNAHQYDLAFTLDIETDVPINILAEIAAGRLTAVSSNTEVISTNGLGISIGKPGTATVTVKHGNAQDTIDFTVEAMVENTLAEIIAMPKDKVVNFWAQVTGTYGDSGVFVGNGDYGILLYKTKLPGGVKVGDKILVTGAKTSPYNGLPELAGASIRVPADFPADKVVAPTTMVFDQAPLPTFTGGTQSSRPANVKGAKIVAIKESTKEYNSQTKKIIEGTFDIAGTEINFYIDGRYASQAIVNSWSKKRTEEAESAVTLRVGDTVDFTGFSYVGNNKPQFVCCNNSNVVLGDGKYAVSIDDGITNGAVEAEVGTLDYGTEVTVTATPSDGYELSKLYVETKGGNIDIAKDKKWTVTCPGVIKAEFAEIPTTAAEIPANGVTITAAEVQNTYDKNKNQQITVSGIKLVTDPDSAGVLTINSTGGTNGDGSLWGYKGANGGNAVLQTKKVASQVFLRTVDKIASASSVTAKFYTTYNTNTNVKYYPAIQFGDKVVTPTLGEMTDLNIKSAKDGGGYEMYSIDATYNLSELNGEKISFVTTNDSTCYFASIVINA